MTPTLEATTIQLQQTGQRGRPPETLADKAVQIGVPESPYLQPRPSQWFAVTASQLGDLLKLAPNWDSYGADSPVPDIVASAIGLLQSLGRHFDLPAPLVTPTRAGGVLLEWRTGGANLEVELVSTHAASYLFWDESTGEEYEGAVFPDNFDDGRILDLLHRFL